MPVSFDTFTIYMPNKVGHNNMIRKYTQVAGVGIVDSKHNSVYSLEDGKYSVMTACNPYSRMVSMWDARSRRCIFNQAWWGLSFHDFCQKWLESTSPRATSWFITQAECAKLCGASEFLWAENMPGTLARLNELTGCDVTAEQLGVHYDSQKHRRNWESHWTDKLLEQFDPIFQDDMAMYLKDNDCD